MNDIAKMFQENSFARDLIDSLPCGLFIVDGDGRIQAVNNIIERLLDTPEQAIVGKGSGDALGCIYAIENVKGCGFSEYCTGCETMKLALSVISSNQKQRSRTYLQILVDNQVRDLTLQISAAPFTFQDKQFATLIIENITRTSSISLPDTEDGFRGIVGRHGKMQDMFDTIKMVARTDAPVLIQGETGAGKELVALAIHHESPRAGKHFAPINCGAVPEGLLESELFGHIKGAFTGAICDKKGRFQLADRGTLFLDEVAELSPVMQVKLLRVLQDGCFEPVGSEVTVRVNVRVISATNRKLEEEVKAGRFRQDLYYRLNVMFITPPPLRELSDDIPLLAGHFLTHFSEESLGKKVTLSPMALSAMMSYSWPGNVRELQNVLQFALAKCRKHVIDLRDFPPSLRLSMTKPSLVQRREPKLNALDVAEALKMADGNKRRAAEILGVARSTLYRFFADQEKESANL